MRIRSTKPEFWRSRTVASVDWAARLVLKGMESYVDDNGVGKDDLALIVGDVFPRDTLARLSEALGQLHEAGLLHRYEADGRPLVYISNWESIQRIDKPGKGRLPRPDGTMDYRDSMIRESVANVREGVAPGAGEQGNRGTEEQGGLGSPTSVTSPVLDTRPKSPHCPKHPDGTTAPCRACGDARTAHTSAQADTARVTAQARSEEARQAATDRRNAIDNCNLCDNDGYAGRGVCAHDPNQADTATRGAALVRAALQRPGQVA